MGRSSSIFIFFALITAGPAIAVAAVPGPTPLGASRAAAGVLLAQGYGGRPGDGLGDGFGPPGPYPGPGLDGLPPPPPFALAPPPCIRPIIIEVGRGLEHRVKTRIVYGARPACS